MPTENHNNHRSPNPNKKTLVKIGGLFENTSTRNGEQFLTGRFGYGARILVLKNSAKTPDSPSNVPHWNIFVYEDTPEQ